jgi:2,4-dienoyl-CoA reductase-like NADH-dependent reductase (Old Yellow Enzyme family)
MSTTQPSFTLLAPAPLGPYKLSNRVVMAPMTRSRASGEGARAQ